MVMRKGLGKGRGKGYRNIIMGHDRRVHRESKYGIKQAQKIAVYDSPRSMPRYTAIIGKKRYMVYEDGRIVSMPSGLKPVGLKVNVKSLPVNIKRSLSSVTKGKDTDNDGVIDIYDCQPLNPGMQDSFEFKDVEDVLKKKGTTGKYAKKAYQYAKTQYEKFKESQEQKRAKELKNVRNPLFEKVNKQQDRVQEIRKQISEEQDPNEESKLFDELQTEERQLRQAQERITEIDLEDLSDSELRTLAVRHRDQSFFGSFSNKYADELVNRERRRKQLDQRLKEERSRKVPESIF